MTLSRKQVEKIIQLKAEGYTDGETARKVRVGVSSVKKHKRISADEIAKGKQ